MRERARLVAQLLSAADMSALVLAFFSAYWIRNAMYGASRGELDLLLHARVLFVALPVFALVFYYSGLYGSYRLHSLLSELVQIGKACSWATLILITLAFVLKYQFVSRVFLLAFAALSFAFVAAQRLAIRFLARTVRSRGYNLRNMMLVGSGERARELAETIQEHGYWGVRLLGQISENGDTQGLPGIPLLANLDNFAEALSGRVVDGVAFAVPHDQLAKIKPAFELCREVGIPVHIYAAPFDDFSGPIELEDIGERKFLIFPTTVHNDYQLFWKRVFDIVVSIVLLVLFAPLIIVIAFVIKLTSPGPVIFRQVRVGMNGRLFPILKFRTMREDAEQARKAVLAMNEMDGPVFKIRNDPRTTTIGGFLRRTSLDELPQLFNVLVGHMSLVGPRPPLPEEVEKYARWQRRRLSVRPGLTCLWQVSGRNNIDFQTWMKLDLQYIDNWSWGLDLKIILLTIPAVLKGR